MAPRHAVRSRYRVPDTDETAVPQKYRTGAVAEGLAARVTALQKSDELRRHAAQRSSTAAAAEEPELKQSGDQQAADARERLEAARRERERQDQDAQAFGSRDNQPDGPAPTRGPRL
ncbi:hypothetical protein [Microbacterium sp. Bi128]|uniref:hypothetical protein n=1 Tax=Microbacterium sp. Bi128 TaxID=2821115 RepID=UPI001E391C46|nr:hypothetical protein [Microbacterium sp. Bi128]